MNHYVKCYAIQPNNIQRWLVIGKTKEYLVTKNSCTCRDFLTKIMKNDENKCKHINMYLEALETNTFDVYPVSISEFQELRPFLLEIKK